MFVLLKSGCKYAQGRGIFKLRKTWLHKVTEEKSAKYHSEFKDNYAMQSIICSRTNCFFLEYASWDGELGSLLRAHSTKSQVLTTDHDHPSKMDLDTFYQRGADEVAKFNRNLFSSLSVTGSDKQTDRVDFAFISNISTDVHKCSSLNISFK